MKRKSWIWDINAIIQEMESHAKADESFHVTANMVLSLARRSREIFESSEVEEKRHQKDLNT